MTRLRRWTVALVIGGLMGAANAWMGSAHAKGTAAEPGLSSAHDEALFRPDGGVDSFR